MYLFYSFSKMDCPNCECKMELQVGVNDYYDAEAYYGHGQTEYEYYECPNCSYMETVEVEEPEYEPELDCIN